jgi:hypothetical protein
MSVPHTSSNRDHQHIHLLPLPLTDSSIEIKHLPTLFPRLLIRQHIRDDTPHLTRNLVPLPTHHAALLPLFFDLFSLAGRNLHSVSNHHLPYTQVPERDRERVMVTDLLRLPLLQPIKPRKDGSFLRLKCMHIGDEISGAKCRVERREGTAEGLCGGEERGSLRAEVEDLGVELGELFGCACFGCVLGARVRLCGEGMEGWR